MSGKPNAIQFCLRYLLSILVLSTFAADVATATFFNNSTGLPNPDQTIDFSEHVFADDTAITTQFSDLGVSFSPGLYYENTFAPGVPHSVPPVLTNFLPANGSGLQNPFSITFSSPISAAAFVLGTNPNTTTFTALFHGIPVDSGVAFTNLNNSTDFYGFMGIVFDRIDVSVGTDGYAVFDTLQIGTLLPTDVPEPSTWALILLGASGVAGVMRFRKRMS